MDALDRALLNEYQGGFPLVERPFLAVAERLGIAEDEAIARVQRLLDEGVVTRFGPLFQIERVGGQFVLAAMAVPAADYERAAAAVNALPEIAHNYQREHALNMWFVIAVERPEDLAGVVARLEAAAGYPVHAFPKEREYFVGMQWRA